MSLRTRLFNRIRRAFGRSQRRVNAYGSTGAGRLLAGRILGEMPAIYSSPDSYLRGGLREWRAKARWQTQTNPYARQIVRTLETNLIGPRGIQMRGNITLDVADPGEQVQKDARRNKILEDVWCDFVNCDSFDLSGQRSFHEFELAIARSFVAHGGCLVRIIRQKVGRSTIPLCFELISAEQLDEQYTQISDLPNRAWRMGVEFDTNTGRRTRYAILNRHPGDSEFQTATVQRDKHTFVSADDLIHVFIPEEIGQTREIPWLLPAMTTIQNINSYEEAHWTRKKVANNTLGFIQKPEPDVPGLTESSSSLASETDPSTGEIISSSSPGQWIELLPGETPIPPNFGPDDQMYPNVLKTMLRRMASGTGMSYAGLSKDFSDTNYSSSRMSELQDRDYWRTLQSQLIKIFHQRVYEEFIDAAIIGGALPLSDFGDYYTYPYRFTKPRWIARTWAFVDPAKDMAALEKARELGLQTAGRQIAEIYGDDLETVWAQIAYEQELAEELGIKLGKQAAPAPAAPPEEEPVELEEEPEEPEEEEPVEEPEELDE